MIMRREFLPLLVTVLLLQAHCSIETHRVKSTTVNGYTYEYVTNDPSGTRIYTLDNGLKVYLSDYEVTPRVQVSIAIKAGGKNDPTNNTGLAHYLEHMMFKGNQFFGTNDYVQEEVLLDSIELLFNQYAKLTDTLERKNLYKQIDDLSYRASAFAIPNEYDRMISAIGGQYLNAYTTQDRTVYIVDVPSNELERLIRIEGSRFKKIVNRLFHTELETVYEEKNRSLDNDNRKVSEKINELLFETHPYGTQTVIGTIEHLKNPSITEIEKYFDLYYGPNNAAICISGDIDFEETIQWINNHFGDWEPNSELPTWNKIEENQIDTPREADVFGPNAERIDIGFRLNGYNTDDFLKATLIDMLLNNGEAGLIDINLIQQQKVLSAGSYISDNQDYSIHRIYGMPKEGQSLDQVRELLLEQIQNIKDGAFDSWLIEAVINDLKKNQMLYEEDVDFANYYRSYDMVMAFANEIPWLQHVTYFDRLSDITKEELVAFANLHYTDNYGVVYKKTGRDPNARKVEKPAITKVQVNSEDTSEFHQNLLNSKVEKLDPKFIDFTAELDFFEVDKWPVVAKENNSNDLFELTYLFDFGKNFDKRLHNINNDLLNILGTHEYSPEELQKEFYRLGSSYTISHSSRGNRIYITLRGLNQNLKPSLELFEGLLQNPVGSQEALDLLVDRILKSRADVKKNKNAVLSRLRSYSIYGPINPQTDILSERELRELSIDELTDLIKDLGRYHHRVLYYGNSNQNELSELLRTYHFTTDEVQEVGELVQYQEVSYDKAQVYWSHFDMVQSEINLLAKLETFDNQKSPAVAVFNEYFAALVFQEIREAQGLAYSVSCYYSQGTQPGYSDFLNSYVGIQSDKQIEALNSMFYLINTPLDSEQAFQVAKDAVINQIESERITKSGVLDSYIEHIDRSLDTDSRELVYQIVKDMSFNDLKAFQDEYISNTQHNIAIVGNRDNIDFENLATYGKVTELSLEELFGY